MELAIIIVGGIASLIILAITTILVIGLCSNGINSQSIIFPIIGLLTLGLNGILYYLALTHASVGIICAFGIPALLLDIVMVSAMFLERKSIGILLLEPSIVLFILALVQ